MRRMPHFIGCDWGTSNFRLWLVERESLNILAETKSDHGVKKVYEGFRAQNKVNQRQYFANFLKDQILTLSANHRSTPIIVSGMASSTIGLKELPYTDFPFDKTGAQLHCEEIPLDDIFNILLISGVKSASGMIRGEETEALGLSDELEHFDRGTLILPGTHSKHIQFEKGVFKSLTNFMTGELFEVLSKKSILQSSVAEGPWDQTAEAAFRQGFNLGFQGKITSSLLMVRAREIIEGISKEENHYFLSGLLIGDELTYLKEDKDKICLAAPHPVFLLYKTALELVKDLRQLELFDSKIMEKALLTGQRRILSIYGK